MERPFKGGIDGYQGTFTECQPEQALGKKKTIKKPKSSSCSWSVPVPRCRSEALSPPLPPTSPDKHKYISESELLGLNQQTAVIYCGLHIRLTAPDPPRPPHLHMPHPPTSPHRSAHAVSSLLRIPDALRRGGGRAAPPRRLHRLPPLMVARRINYVKVCCPPLAPRWPRGPIDRLVRCDWPGCFVARRAPPEKNK